MLHNVPESPKDISHFFNSIFAHHSNFSTDLVDLPAWFTKAVRGCIKIFDMTDIKFSSQ